MLADRSQHQPVLEHDQSRDLQAYTADGRERPEASAGPAVPSAQKIV